MKKKGQNETFMNLAHFVWILVPSARKGLQMKMWRFYFAFAFVMERLINSPQILFRICFVMVMLGKWRLQQQAILTNKNIKSQRFSCAFAFVIQQRENPKSWDLFSFFACKCFCEDGNRVWFFSLRKTSTIHIELLFRNAPAKSSWTDLSLVWSAGATSDLSTAGTFRKELRKTPRRPRKLSRSFSWNSPQGYGWDPSSPVIEDIWSLQRISRILSPSIRLRTPPFSEVVLKRAFQSWSWNSQQYWARKKKVYTTTVETLLSFPGSEASMVYTFFPDLCCIPFSLVWPRTWYTPQPLFALWPRGRATDRERGASLVVYTLREVGCYILRDTPEPRQLKAPDPPVRGTT